MPTPSARELAHNPLLARLAAGELAASLIVRLFDGPEIGRIAATAGFDALYVDLEHSPLPLASTSRICNAARDAGVTPLARVPSIDAALIGRVLDGGAMGIIATQIETPADAERLVACCLYPPRGTRSVASGQPVLNYREYPQAEALQALNDNVLIAVMIESAAALENVEAIAAVDGLHMLFIGAHDLASALGLPGQWDHPALHKGLERIRLACRNAGKALGLGGLTGQPELLRQLAAGPGGSFVSMGTDLACLLSAATQRAAFAHGLR